MDGGERTVRGRDTGEVAAHPLDAQPAATADGVQDAQGVCGVQGLAHGSAQIRFEGVAVAAVLVEIGGQGGLDRIRASAQEVIRESPLLQHPGREPDELLGAGKW